MSSSSSCCSLERRGSVFILRLHGDGEHRIHPRMVDSVLACLATLPSPAPPASVLITTNDGKFFCNGLDLSFPSRSPVKTKMAALLSAFLSLPMPTIAAVCGHASAGGFILALAHDHILMRRDRGFLYMSEIDVNILIPPGPMDLIRCKMPPLAFRDSVLCGVKHTAQMALEAGIISSVHDDSEQTLEAAVKFGQTLVARNWNPTLYRDMRAAMYPEVFEKLHIKLESSIPPASKL